MRSDGSIFFAVANESASMFSKTAGKSEQSFAEIGSWIVCLYECVSDQRSEIGVRESWSIVVPHKFEHIGTRFRSLPIQPKPSVVKCRYRIDPPMAKNSEFPIVVPIGQRTRVQRRPIRLRLNISDYSVFNVKDFTCSQILPGKYSPLSGSDQNSCFLTS